MSYTAVKRDALGALRENIVVFRARAGLSQEQLASKARVSRPVVSKMEQGSSAPSFDVLPKIADVLGCSIAELLLHEHDAALSNQEIMPELNPTPTATLMSIDC
jgi:transcriptional regulator with XRE-family HTH domain